jgi:uncharacterized protein YfcZ (UPF0381/DUF406 family)
MKLKERLTQAEANLQKLAEKHNALEAEKQELLKEILRVDGQVALLKELVKEATDGE